MAGPTMSTDSTDRGGDRPERSPEYYDELFSILSIQRRREVVAILYQQQSDIPLSVGALADAIERRQPSLATDDANTRLQTALWHCDLPLLEDISAISLTETNEIIVADEDILNDAYRVLVELDWTE